MMNEEEREKLVKYISQYIIDQWTEQESKIAQFYAGDSGDESAARKLISTFIEYCDTAKINPDDSQEASVCFHAMRRVLGRVMDVDMSKSANRKGDLPKALGLVSRRDASNIIRDHVIYYACDHLKFNTGVPGRSDEDCFDIVMAAMEHTKKFGTIEDAGLTSEQIKKIYYRRREEGAG